MKIYVVITMDCERPPSGAVPLASGPPDLATSEAWVRAYARRAANYDFPVTFFLHPEVATDQADLYRELEAEGACLGMHLHPWKFVGGRYKAHFGGLPDDQMRACLKETTAMWSDAIGRHPLYFRPGTFSANDNSFRILTEQGFRGGSISVPGRFYPKQNAIWTGAEPDPHRGHICFRQLAGSLDFANMPVSVDLSGIIEKDGKTFHWDLRPDFAVADYQGIARNILTQVLSRKPLVPVINMITHNDHDYTDDDERNTRHFETVLRAITDACEAEKLEPVGTTIEKICDLVLAAPPAEPGFDPVAMPRGFFEQA